MDFAINNEAEIDENTENPQQEETEKKDKVPPTILSDKSKHFHVQNINILKAQALSDDVRINPRTSDVYRKIVRYCNQKEIEYHRKSSFMLWSGAPQNRCTLNK